MLSTFSGARMSCDVFTVFRELTLISASPRPEAFASEEHCLGCEEAAPTYSNIPCANGVLLYYIRQAQKLAAVVVVLVVAALLETLVPVLLVILEIVATGECSSSSRRRRRSGSSFNHGSSKQPRAHMRKERLAKTLLSATGF